MKNLLVVLILSVVLISCSKSEPIGKYQAIEANGNLIIVNTTDGSGAVYRWLETPDPRRFPGDTVRIKVYRNVGRITTFSEYIGAGVLPPRTQKTDSTSH